MLSTKLAGLVVSMFNFDLVSMNDLRLVVPYLCAKFEKMMKRPRGTFMESADSTSIAKSMENRGIPAVSVRRCLFDSADIVLVASNQTDDVPNERFPRRL